MSKHWEAKMLKNILNEKYLREEEDDMPAMTKEDKKAFYQNRKVFIAYNIGFLQFCI